MSDTWDSGLDWDTPGLVWDVGVQSESQRWLNLITSEHNQQPNYMATLTGVLDNFADIYTTVTALPLDYDLDTAVGVQLDTIGLWIGVTRNIAIPITGVFFSWEIVGLGWTEGSWYDPANPTQLVQLNDTDYRTLLRATIAANMWDGTTPGAYDAWNDLFAGTGLGILIQDYNDMSFTYALTGNAPSAVTLALFTGGYLNLQPAGVRVRAYVTPATPNAPYFAWGVVNSNLAGWGTGQWGVYNPGA